jgi:uncharacterized membrane protein YraQ (UPF0718 family)
MILLCGFIICLHAHVNLYKNILGVHMFNEQFQIAFDEFLHVGIALVLIIAVIAVITGFVREYIPQEKLQKKLREQGTVKGAFMGAGLGVLTPFCSASMVPVAMGMIEMSAPFSTVLPFLISAPLSNFVVVGIIFATFGFDIAVFYFLWTFSSAVIAGLTVGRSSVRHQVRSLEEINGMDNKKSSSCSVSNTNQSCTDNRSESSCSTSNVIQDCSETSTSSCSSPSSNKNNHKEKAKGALRFGLVLFKKIVPYAILGALISGIALAYVPTSLVEEYVGGDAWYAIPLAAGIGVPLYLRIEMVIPLLSTLLAKGMSMGAAIALLIGGTGASIPELALLSSMLKPKGILAFTLTVLVIAMLGGTLFMFL